MESIFKAFRGKGEEIPATDAGVLTRPSKEELALKEVRNVFSYRNELKKRYDIGKVLGAGSFGVVREAIEKSTGRRFACKTIPKIPKRGVCTPRYLLKLQTEVDVMQQLGASLDSVYLQNVYEDPDSIHMVMELCEGGGILDRIKERPFTEKRVAFIIRSILRFIAQCHAKGIIYRDVKPDNFLFLTKDPNSAVRATDFGLSIRHWPGDGYLKSRSGTPVFMAPEIIMQEYGALCDEWSVGMLMYQLLTGSFPFWDSVQNISLQQVWQAILVKKVDLDAPKLQETMSEGARDLLKKLLRRDPGKRITAVQALEHPWVKEGGSASDASLTGSVVQRLQRYATYGHLKQLVLRLIADDVVSSSDDVAASEKISEKIVALRDLFNQLDVDGSGGISLKELSQGLSKQGYNVSPMEVERLMARLDLNADGNIQIDEFAASMIDWQDLQQDVLWEKWVDMAFQKLDSNGDGFIDLEELIAKLPIDDATSAATRTERHLEAKRMVREADTDGDGLVSKDEFLNLLQQTSVPDSLDQYDSRITRAMEPVEPRH